MNPNNTPIYKEGTAPIQDRVDNLVSQMTLGEKVSQMVHDAPAIERLGVPAYNWWNECLHGVGRAGIATVFPQAIGLAATWNVALIHQVAVATSDEARAKHHDALRKDIHKQYFGLTFWSPNINIFRDPRWGRGQETYGECPYLTARMGVAFVKGLQGNDAKYLKLVATPKHYAVHSGPEPDRHTFNAIVDERDLRETYLPHFETCVKEAVPYSIMGAYNRTNGEACCASPTLLEKILRQEWGFDGYVVSDCGAILDIYADSSPPASTWGCLTLPNRYPTHRSPTKSSTRQSTVRRRYRQRVSLSCYSRMKMPSCPCQRTLDQLPSSAPMPTTSKCCWATTGARPPNWLRFWKVSAGLFHPIPKSPMRGEAP
jgi:beta-glucosidase-like glycosyl hydrolase